MRRVFGVLILFLFCTSLTCAQAQDLKTLKEKAVSLEEDVAIKLDTGVNNTITGSMDFLSKVVREESKNDPAPLAIRESIIVTLGDLLLSLFCLVLAIYFVTKASVPEKYLWFLFIFNVSWFCLVVVAKGVWSTLDYLVIKLEPGYGPSIHDHFFIVFVIASILLYVWLLARAFGLNFYGALGSFLVAHIAYFFAVGFIFAVLSMSAESKLFISAKEAVGIRSVIRNYTVDMKNISTNAGWWSFVKFKYYHL